MFDIDFYHNYPFASLIGVGNSRRDRFVQSHDVSCEHAQSLKKTEVEELLPGAESLSSWGSKLKAALSKLLVTLIRRFVLKDLMWPLTAPHLSPTEIL